ncbi:MAG: chromate transporter [Bacteroidales bacterium]
MNQKNTKNIYLEMFWSFFKIGAFTIGGGYAMLPLIQREVVDRKKWIDSKEFLDMTVLAQTAPGLLAMNISIAVGNKIKGKKGALVSSIGAALPSFVSILIIAIFLTKFQDNIYIKKMFKALRPVVVALLVIPIITLSKGAGLNWKNVWMPIVAAVGISFFNLSPVWFILAAILGGIGWAYTKKRRVKE